jgi:hypothetical protein
VPPTTTWTMMPRPVDDLLDDDLLDDELPF